MKRATNRLHVGAETIRVLAKSDMAEVFGGRATTCRNSDCHSCATTPPPVV